MDVIKIKKSRLSFLLLLAVSMSLISLILYNCGGDSGYSDPEAKAATTSVLISPETLNALVTNGYGTDEAGYNKMVVLDVASASGTTSYTGSGHVPGAFLLDTATDLTVARSEGIGGSYSDDSINTPSMVATRDMMDAFIQKTGIDENTVVVITGDSLLNMGSAYFNFRYWGFPKERLKVLDRTNAKYITAGFSLDTAVPAAPTPSTYSVCNLTQNTSLRASLSDMINVAEGEPNSIAWDVRTLNEFNGVAGGTSGPLGNPKKVAFEGHVKGAKHLNYLDLLDDLQNDAVILDKDTVKTLLADAGITPDKTAHMY